MFHSKAGKNYFNILPYQKRHRSAYASLRKAQVGLSGANPRRLYDLWQRAADLCQIHRQPPIVACDQQSPAAERPVPLTAGAARRERAVAPKYHQPVFVAHAVVLEPPSVHRRDRYTVCVRG